MLTRRATGGKSECENICNALQAFLFQKTVKGGYVFGVV